MRDPRLGGVRCTEAALDLVTVLGASDVDTVAPNSPTVAMPASANETVLSDNLWWVRGVVLMMSSWVGHVAVPVR